MPKARNTKAAAVPATILVRSALRADWPEILRVMDQAPELAVGLATLDLWYHALRIGIAVAELSDIEPASGCTAAAGGGAFELPSASIPAVEPSKWAPSKIVGVMAVEYAGYASRILAIAVAADQRRRKVASQLVDELVARAPRGTTRLVADVPEKNLSGHLFLRSCGFSAMRLADRRIVFVRRILEGAHR